MLVENGLMLATALAPEVGYDKAADISKEAFKTGQTIREVAREQTDLSEEELDEAPDSQDDSDLRGRKRYSLDLTLLRGYFVQILASRLSPCGGRS